jgi:hypothetical protein
MPFAGRYGLIADGYGIGTATASRHSGESGARHRDGNGVTRFGDELSGALPLRPVLVGWGRAWHFDGLGHL